MSEGSGVQRLPPIVWIGGGVLAVVMFVALASAGAISLHASFVALASVMLLLALAALWQALRAAFADRGTDEIADTSFPERAALVDEKNALLRAIKDIAFEHEVGKLSSEEFARLDRAYRLRAKEVLQRLDADLEPYLARAEQLLAPEPPVVEEKPVAEAKKPKKKKAPRRACPACGTSNAASARWCKQCGAAVAPKACPACKRDNEPDARFCIGCAAPMDAGDAPAEERP